jgi:hypothetical protein
MEIVKKYEFENESIVDSLIRNLGVETDDDGNEFPTHENAIVKIGNFIVTDGEIDADGNEITPPVLYDKFCVDVFWNDENDSAIAEWSAYEITIENEGVHKFAGVNYITNE